MKLRIVTLVCGLFLLAIPSRALVATWSGGGGPGNTDVTSLANWDLVPLVPGEDLIFPNITYRQANFNSATLLTSLLGSNTFTAHDMTFSNATNYSLSGSGTPILELSGDMTLTSTNVNLLNSLPFQITSGAHTLTVNDTSLLEFQTTVGGIGSLIKEGSGTLKILGASTYSGGTTVSAGSLIVDAGSGFSGSISHVSNDMIVGGAGSGTLSIVSGGTVSSDQGIIGNNVGETGLVTVQDSGSAWNTAADLYVGNAGNGVLYLYNEGKVNVIAGSGTLHLGHISTGAGSLTIGSDGTNYFSGGIVNAANITTDAGVSGELKFATNATALNPYYLTKDGLSNGAPVLISGNTEVQQVSGYTVLKSSNDYTGATYVSGGTLIVSDDNALGQGFSSVTVNGGTLVVNDINFYNPLTLTSGTLAGSGYVAANTTIGPGVTLSPGLPVTPGRIGSLDFQHLELASGGTMEWNLQNPTGGDGAAGTNWDLVTISTPTSLVVTANSGSRFTLKLISLDAAGALGTATGFVPGQAYSWLIFGSDHTTGFDPTKFDLDLSQFFTDSVEISNISLTNTGDLLYLNFTPVPEPSTYALMALGLAGTGLAAWRKRRHVSRGR